MSDHRELPVHTVTIAVDVNALDHKSAADLAGQVVNQVIESPGHMLDSCGRLVSARVAGVDACPCQHGTEPAAHRTDRPEASPQRPREGPPPTGDASRAGNGNHATSLLAEAPGVALVPEPVLLALHREYLDRLALAAGEHQPRNSPSER